MSDAGMHMEFELRAGQRGTLMAQGHVQPVPPGAPVRARRHTQMSARVTGLRIPHVGSYGAVRFDGIRPMQHAGVGIHSTGSSQACVGEGGERCGAGVVVYGACAR